MVTVLPLKCWYQLMLGAAVVVRLKSTDTNFPLQAMTSPSGSAHNGSGWKIGLPGVQWTSGGIFQLVPIPTNIFFGGFFSSFIFHLLFFDH